MDLLSAGELVSTSTFVKASPDNDGLDKKTMNPTYCINIKSEGLRNIRANNMNDDQVAV